MRTFVRSAFSTGASVSDATGQVECRHRDNPDAIDVGIADVQRDVTDAGARRAHERMTSGKQRDVERTIRIDRVASAVGKAASRAGHGAARQRTSLDLAQTRVLRDLSGCSVDDDTANVTFAHGNHRHVDRACFGPGAQIDRGRRLVVGRAREIDRDVPIGQRVDARTKRVGQYRIARASDPEEPVRSKTAS